MSRRGVGLEDGAWASAGGGGCDGVVTVDHATRVHGGMFDDGRTDAVDIEFRAWQSYLRSSYADGDGDDGDAPPDKPLLSPRVIVSSVAAVPWTPRRHWPARVEHARINTTSTLQYVKKKGKKTGI